MLIHLKNVLGPNELIKVRDVLANAKYVDGKYSAGLAAAKAKQNQEISADDQSLQEQSQNEDDASGK